jgi:hypothetical protein
MTQVGRIRKIRDTLTIEQQKEFDLGMNATEEYKELFQKLAKT